MKEFVFLGLKKTFKYFYKKISHFMVYVQSCQMLSAGIQISILKGSNIKDTQSFSIRTKSCMYSSEEQLDRLSNN